MQNSGKMAAIARQPAWENPQHNFAAAIGLKLWNELIWPSRRTWGALAAVWVVLAIINISNRMSFQTPAQSTESRSPEAFADLGNPAKVAVRSHAESVATPTQAQHAGYDCAGIRQIGRVDSVGKIIARLSPNHPKFHE